MTTSTRTVSRDIVVEACESLNAEYDIREDYSGRNMYGSTCFGVVVDNPAEFLMTLGAFLVEAAWQADESMTTDLAVELGSHASMDSMGLDTIVYFPGWTLAED